MINNHHYFYDLTHSRDKGRNRDIFSFVFWFKSKLQNLLSRLGVIHKLRLQDKVGRWSKNFHFLSTFIP